MTPNYVHPSTCLHIFSNTHTHTHTCKHWIVAMRICAATVKTYPLFKFLFRAAKIEVFFYEYLKQLLFITSVLLVRFTVFYHQYWFIGFSYNSLARREHENVCYVTYSVFTLRSMTPNISSGWTWIEWNGVSKRSKVVSKYIFRKNSKFISISVPACAVRLIFFLNDKPNFFSTKSDE